MTHIADRNPGVHALDGGEPAALRDIYKALKIQPADHVSLASGSNGSWQTQVHTAKEAVKLIENLQGNVYFGLNPVDVEVGTVGKRGKAGDVTRIVGLPGLRRCRRSDHAYQLRLYGERRFWRALPRCPSRHGCRQQFTAWPATTA